MAGRGLHIGCFHFFIHRGFPLSRLTTCLARSAGVTLRSWTFPLRMVASTVVLPGACSLHSTSQPSGHAGAINISSPSACRSMIDCANGLPTDFSESVLLQVIWQRAFPPTGRWRSGGCRGRRMRPRSQTRPHRSSKLSSPGPNTRTRRARDQTSPSCSPRP